MEIRTLITRLFARRYLDLAKINSFEGAGISLFFFLNKSNGGAK